MKRYKVVVGVDSDKKGKRWEPGDVVTERDFPKYVIAEWVEQGVLEPEDQEVDDGGNA
jgi:hypothetical protein